MRSWPEVRVFRIRLGADRDVLASGHGHRARDEPCDPGDEDTASCGSRRRDANDEARCRDQTVVRAEDRGAKPADMRGAMSFDMH